MNLINDNMDENAAKVSPYLIRSEGACKDLGEEDFYSKNINGESELLREFNKNIHRATIRDMEKLNFWKKDFEEQVIIQGIYPIATIANTPIFFKVGAKHCYAPG